MLDADYRTDTDVTAPEPPEGSRQLMRTLSGEIELIGNGTWFAGNLDGATLLSAFRIGDVELKRVVLPDYLANFVKLGIQAKLLVDDSFWTTWRPHKIIAAEVEGKRYKATGFVLPRVLGTLVYVPIILLLGVVHWAFILLLPIALWRAFRAVTSFLAF